MGDADSRQETVDDTLHLERPVQGGASVCPLISSASSIPL